MKVQLHSTRTISGKVVLPGSKSISNRVLIIQALSGLNFELNNKSTSDDTIYLEQALSGKHNQEIIHVGHAGTDMRFLTAFFALQDKTVVLTGSERLKERPIKELVSVLRSLGADITYIDKEGFSPLRIHGTLLEGGVVNMNASVSSQFITALLLVAPYFKNGLSLRLLGELVSKPYIELTLAIMKEFGAVVHWEKNIITVEPVPYCYPGKSFLIESDWSAASYYYSIVALSELNTKIELTGLFPGSYQADGICAELYKRFGVETSFENGNAVLLKKEEPSKKFLEMDFRDCPDIVQTVAVTCVALRIPFRFSGLQTLKLKETDRIIALQTEFQKLDINLKVSDNRIEWLDETSISVDETVWISTYHDHRMAMSFAPLSILIPGIIIDDAHVVSKSYPNFWHDLQNIGIEHKLTGDNF